MGFNFGFLIAAFTAIFIVINPISKVPFFLILTKGFSREEKSKVILNAIKASAPLLVAIAIGGMYLFQAFNVSFLALKFVGAIVLLSMGFDMLKGQVPQFKSSDDERQEAVEKEMVGVVPLGIPMMAGPGTMITVMLYMSETTNISEYLFIIGFILITCLITYLLLIESDAIFKRMGNVGLQTIMRVMGILIAAIGIQVFLDAIQTFILDTGALL